VETVHWKRGGNFSVGERHCLIGDRRRRARLKCGTAAQWVAQVHTQSYRVVGWWWWRWWRRRRRMLARTWAHKAKSSGRLWLRRHSLLVIDTQCNTAMHREMMESERRAVTGVAAKKSVHSGVTDARPTHMHTRYCRQISSRQSKAEERHAVGKKSIYYLRDIVQCTIIKTPSLQTKSQSKHLGSSLEF